MKQKKNVDHLKQTLRAIPHMGSAHATPLREDMKDFMSKIAGTVIENDIRKSITQIDEATKHWVVKDLVWANMPYVSEDTESSVRHSRLSVSNAVWELFTSLQESLSHYVQSSTQEQRDAFFNSLPEWVTLNTSEKYFTVKKFMWNTTVQKRFIKSGRADKKPAKQKKPV